MDFYKWEDIKEDIMEDKDEKLPDRYPTRTCVERTACSALEELRQAHKTQNYSYMLGLIEELQSHYNRMESSLYAQKTMMEIIETISVLKKEEKSILTTLKRYDVKVLEFKQAISAIGNLAAKKLKLEEEIREMNKKLLDNGE